MHLQSFVTPGTLFRANAVPSLLPPPGSDNFLLTPPIGVFLGFLESGRLKLLMAFDLPFVAPSFLGRGVFSTPRVFSTLGPLKSPSPKAPQVPRVTPGSPLCLFSVAGTSYGEVHDTRSLCTSYVHFIYFVIQILNFLRHMLIFCIECKRA